MGREKRTHRIKDQGDRVTSPTEPCLADRDSWARVAALGNSRNRDRLRLDDVSAELGHGDVGSLQAEDNLLGHGLLGFCTPSIPVGPTRRQELLEKGNSCQWHEIAFPDPPSFTFVFCPFSHCRRILLVDFYRRKGCRSSIATPP